MSSGRSSHVTLMRWLRFNAVGGIGIAIQLAVLAALKGGLHLNYLAATALAVEAAVINNFLWHERWTWADRASAGRSFPRFVKFNLSTGVLSIVENVALMKALVSWGHLPYLPANLLAIAICTVANFLLSDRFVFGPA